MKCFCLGLALYEHLTNYVLSEDELKENGYPFPHPAELGKAVIEGVYAHRTQYCNDRKYNNSKIN